MRLAITVLMLVRGLLLAQQPAPEPSRVEGQVVDAASGQPLRKAAVIVRSNVSGQDGWAVYTDEAGHFTFLGLANGTWQVQVEKTGYVPLGTGQKEQPWRIVEGTAIKDVTLRLTRAGVVTGRVLDTDGEPVAGANVTLKNPEAKPGTLSLPYAQTNDQGEYRLFPVTPGKYLVSVTYEPSWQRNIRLLPAPRKPGRAVPLEDYVTTYYPATMEAGQATPVVIKAGAHVSGIDVQLRRASVVRVSGRVLTESAAPILMINLIEAAPGSRTAGKSLDLMGKPDGTFTFDRVRPGRYLLHAASGFDNEPWQGKQWIEVGNEDVNDVQLTLGPPQTLQGQIRVEGQAKLPAGLHALLEPREENPIRQVDGFTAVKADGSFLLERVYEGRYDLLLAKLAGGPDELYVSAIQFDKQDALVEGLSVGAGGTHSVQVTLRDDGGTVQVKVVSAQGEPVAGAGVLLVPDPPRQRVLAQYEQSQSDEQGEATLSGVAPGSYHALVSEKEPDFQAARDPERVQKRGKKVEVKAKESVRLELTLRPAEQE